MIPHTDAIWTDSRPGRLVLAVWTEKRPGLGEDAAPSFVEHLSSGRGLIAVYDGVGGAGAAPVARRADGLAVSSAFVASRILRGAVEEWFHQTLTDHNVPGPALLDQRIATHLQAARRRRVSRISGTLLRELPSTLASIEYCRGETDTQVAVTVRWAGDSRGFALDPNCGLRQMSRDDSADDDALTLLITDQPMTNYVCADHKFVLHEKTAFLPLPIVLVCSTDGFFGYVATPALFEFLLLNSLKGAHSLAEWGTQLVSFANTISGDDASLALVILGFRDLRELQERFTERTARLDREHYHLFAGLDQDRQREEYLAARHNSWQAYRSDYEQLLRDMQ